MDFFFFRVLELLCLVGAGECGLREKCRTVEKKPTDSNNNWQVSLCCLFIRADRQVRMRKISSSPSLS